MRARGGGRGRGVRRGDVRPHGAADGPALARAVVGSAVGEFFLTCSQFLHVV